MAPENTYLLVGGLVLVLFFISHLTIGRARFATAAAERRAALILNLERTSLPCALNALLLELLAQERLLCILLLLWL